MTDKTYEVTVETTSGGTRTVGVPSPTGVQAGDAARPLMQEGEAILGITEVRDDEGRIPDALPPRTQAEELASVTPGVAAVSTHDGGSDLG